MRVHSCKVARAPIFLAESLITEAPSVVGGGTTTEQRGQRMFVRNKFNRPIASMQVVEIVDARHSV